MPDDPNLGLPGADSSAEVTSLSGGHTLLQLATSLYGRAPAFWGRYFKGPGNQGGAHYHPGHESSVLAAQNVRVLPIARQTSNVSGSSATGGLDAQNNVQATFSSFTWEYLAQQGGEYLVYLDVEGAPNPSLSVEYWTGWSHTLRDYSREVSSNNVTLLPGIYCNFDHHTWQSLDYAVHHGAPCASAWVAHWLQNPPSCVTLRPWHPPFVTPNPAPPCPIHAWQYAAECHGGDGFDMNMSAPGLPDADFLRKLILPPA